MKQEEKKAILVIGSLTIIVIAVFFLTRPEAEKKERIEQPIQVETITLEKTTYPFMITANGTVSPSRTVNIRSEVSGLIIEKGKNFCTGCILKENDFLLQIDPRDYEIQVEKEKANVVKAELELIIEQGRQIVAKSEWEQLNPTITTLDISEELALRKPHLKEKEASLFAAKNQLKQALLNLERTTIKSPLDAVVIAKSASEGDYVTPQQELSKLVATSEYEVKVSIPLSKIFWLIPKLRAGEHVPVTIYQDIGSERTLSWTGYTKNLLGDLEESGRMARIVLVIPDPLKKGHSPLLLGSYVRVLIEGPKFDDVFVIPRTAIHNGNTIWIKTEDNQLEIKRITPFLSTSEAILIKDELTPGDQVIISTIPFPVEGMKLK